MNRTLLAAAAGAATILLGFGGLCAQTAADSVAVITAHLDHVLDPERAPHYFGEAPYDLFHPTGTVETFCLGWTERPGSYERPLADGSSLTTIDGRISEAFGLVPGRGCRLTNDEETGLAEVEDAEGRSAVQIGVGVSFDEEGSATVHLGFFTGGFGAMGSICPLERASPDVWTVVDSGCRFYES